MCAGRTYIVHLVFLLFLEFFFSTVVLITMILSLPHSTFPRSPTVYRSSAPHPPQPPPPLGPPLPPNRPDETVPLDYNLLGVGGDTGGRG